MRQRYSQGQSISIALFSIIFYWQGEGLVAITDIDENTVIAQYGGFRLHLGKLLPDNREIPGRPYRHKVGYCDEIIDFEQWMTDATKYNCTLAHKTNHDFDNNVESLPVTIRFLKLYDSL